MSPEEGFACNFPPRMAEIGDADGACLLLAYPVSRVHSLRSDMKPRPSFCRAFLVPLLCAATLPLFAAVTTTQAQEPGGQDASFATGPSSSGSVHALALQPNGQVLVGGGFSSLRGVARNNVARLNADGSLDAFDPGLALTGYNGGSGTVFALGLQADGKVIVGGTFNVLNQTAGSGVARLNADGSLDSSFNVGSGVLDNAGSVGHATAIAVLPNGQILVGGAFTYFNGVYSPGLVRLNADGSVDTTFNAGGSGVATNGYGDPVQAIVVLSSGQILIGGGFDSYDDTPEGGVARLNADGSLDTSFQVGQGADYAVTALGVQANGQILAGGGFNNFDGANIASHLVRLNTDGSLDTGYSPSTPGFFISGIDTLLVQGDGTVIIAGFFFNQGGLVNSEGTGLLRLNADGTLDTSFDGSNGVGEGVALALQPDGNLLVAYDEDGFAATGPGDVLRVYDLLPTPTATVVSGAKKVYESGSKGPATFIVSLSSAPGVKTTVKYALKGAGISGFDYYPVSGKVKVKPGHTTATVSVDPIDMGFNDGGTVAVKLVLLPGSGYNVGSPSTAKDKIIDDN